MDPLGIDPENKQFSNEKWLLNPGWLIIDKFELETHLPTPVSGRVDVNLPNVFFFFFWVNYNDLIATEPWNDG